MNSIRVTLLASLFWLTCAPVAAQEMGVALQALSSSGAGSGRPEVEASFALLAHQMPIGNSPEARALISIVDDEGRPLEVRERALELVIQKSDASLVTGVLGLMDRIASAAESGDEVRQRASRSLMSAFVGAVGSPGVATYYTSDAHFLHVLAVIVKNRAASGGGNAPRNNRTFFELFADCAAPAAEKSAVAVRHILSFPNDTDFPREILNAVDQNGVDELRRALADRAAPEKLICGASAALSDLGDIKTLPILEASEPRLTGKASKRMLAMYNWRIRVQQNPDALLAVIAGDGEIDDPLWAYRRARERGLPAERIAAVVAKRISATKPLDDCKGAAERNFWNGTALLQSEMELIAEKTRRNTVADPKPAPDAKAPPDK